MRTTATPALGPVQRSFDDLGTTLAAVTFCVLDLETTGGDPGSCAITEIGAVRYRGGERLGTFQTLVDPGLPIPPSITVLTGITGAMVLDAPRIGAVLPSLLEFIGGSVLVGHNLRFDVSFLDAALVRDGWPRLGLRTVDTCALARRLVRDEVPNCRLGTLADRFRLPNRPTHRALDDALATADLLHVLLERAAAFGVLGLDDLLGLPAMSSHPQAAKLRLTTRLPRTAGVYVFRDIGGRPLYVGKAANLRSRVRSYFSTDDRRKIGPLLREAQHIEHVPCRSALEAAVLEVRLIHALQPRFNRQGTTWQRAAYLRIDLSEPFPRIAVTRRPASRRDRVVELGPFPSARLARAAAEAVESVVPLRRCSERIRPGRLLAARPAPCAPAQLGVATCPCAGTVSEAEYGVLVARVARGLTVEPRLLLDPLVDRLRALAVAERFEEAAWARDRAAALATGLRRARRFDALRAAGRIVVALPDGVHLELNRGVLQSTWAEGELPMPPPAGVPLPADQADELSAVASFLDRYAARLRLVEVEGEWSTPLPAIPSFRPTKGEPAER